TRISLLVLVSRPLVPHEAGCETAQVRAVDGVAMDVDVWVGAAAFDGNERVHHGCVVNHDQHPPRPALRRRTARRAAGAEAGRTRTRSSGNVGPGAATHAGGGGHAGAHRVSFAAPQLRRKQDQSPRSRPWSRPGGSMPWSSPRLAARLVWWSRRSMVRRVS